MIKLYCPYLNSIFLLMKDHNDVYETNEKKNQGLSSATNLTKIKKYVPTKVYEDQRKHKNLHKKQIMSEAKRNIITVLEIIIKVL